MRVKRSIISLKRIKLNLQAGLLTRHFDMFNIHNYKCKTATMKQLVRHLKSV